MLEKKLDQFIHQSQQRINTALQNRLGLRPNRSLPVHQAMNYSLMAGGKRIRPLLAFASAHAIGYDAAQQPATVDLLDNIACALECIHTYSLIHDDLPAMDDDALRRGKPSCHVAFDEATAILAGDALQSLAFELLSNNSKTNPSISLALVQLLSRAAGDAGMVAGQDIDIQAANKVVELSYLKNMHQHKTGALIKASVQMGATAIASSNAKQIQSLGDYADAIGLAFQVQDDILDVISDTSTLGKQQGADKSLNKPTYVSLLGLDGAKQKASNLHQQALDSISSFDESADTLRQLSDYIVSRNS
jgi:geranylgeranyl diphosphate synthase type II